MKFRKTISKCRRKCAYCGNFKQCNGKFFFKIKTLFMRSETHLPNAHKSHKANPNSKSFTHRKKLLFNHILLYIFKSKIFKM